MSTEQQEIGVEVASVGETSPARMESNDLNSLMHAALERNNVDALERLVALQERVSERNARAAFFQALADFREACPPIMKTRENSQFKVTRGGVTKPSKYAPLEEIDRVARPVAAEVGLVWTWDTTIEGDLVNVVCRVIHVDGHSESASVAMPHGSNAGASPQQKFASTQSYGMRYSLIAALGLTAADEDVDGADGGTEIQTLDDKQVAEVETLLDEITVPGAKGKMLRWIGVNSIAEIPVGWYDDVIQFLESKRGES